MTLSAEIQTESGETGTIETPSGKDAAYENFPVGSFLLPRATRPHVATFYAFARAADDIADDPRLPPEDKIGRLQGFERALTGNADDAERYRKALAMRASLVATGIDPRHCLDLLSAFKQDAIKARYRDWDDLIDYCRRSAAPVGRYLLDLHGGSRDGYNSADALCIALQILNHLQDVKEDYQLLDRVYVPELFLAEAGTSAAALGGPSSTAELSAVIGRMIGGTERLIAEARPLPGNLNSRRLAMESQAIINIADRLSRKISNGDPLRGRIVLSKGQYGRAIFSGILGRLVR